MRMFTHASYAQEAKPRGEVFTKPSQTVPGMVPDLRDLIDRYVRGEHVEQFNPVYIDNDLVPDNFERMDVFDRAELAHELKLGIEQTRQRLGRKKPEKTQEAVPDPVPPQKVEES